MKVRASGRPPGGVRERCLLALLASMLPVGCASPGPPQAPSLHLPEIMQALTAERVGDEVRLRWTTPSKSTDGLGVRGGVTAQLCRLVVRPTAGAQEPCSPVRLLPVKPGPSELVDVLAPALRREPTVVLEYHIALLNADEHSAGLSPAALAAGGPAPPPVTGLRIEATEGGALLQWKPEDAGDRVELERLRTSLSAKGKVKTGLGGPSSPEPAEAHLRALAGSGQGTPFALDAGGTLDPGARRGESYTYTAQRVRRVRVGGHDLELRSAVSVPAAVVMRDTFPPQSPVGVEAIAGRQSGVMGVDLSWTPNTEASLAGYLVFRQEVGGELAVLLTTALVRQPAFRDAGAIAGHSYRYTVVAVDAAGNRSVPSAAAMEEVPLP